MGKGKGCGAGRPLAEIPSTYEMQQFLKTAVDRATGIAELAETYSVSRSTIRRRVNSGPAIPPLNEVKLFAPPVPETIHISSPAGAEAVARAHSGVLGAVAELMDTANTTTISAAPAPASEPLADVEDDEVFTKANNLLFEEDYTYNKEGDTYITFLESAPKPVIVPGAKHRAMLQAYSNWDGQPASINQICRQFDFPRQWLIEYKRVHGWTHDLEPVTHEELRDKPLDELVEQSLQMKRQALYRKFAKREWSDTQAAAEKWYDFEQSVYLPLTEHIANHAPSYKPTRLPLKEAENPFAVIFAAFDIHYAKSAWRDETGDSYGRDECRSLLMSHTSALASQVAKYGRPESLIVPVGSDWFHVDNPWGETVNGTRQDMDGSYAQMLMEGCDLAVEYIDFMRQIAPVTLIYVDGNHDRASSLSMGLYLRAWFRNSADVQCIVKPSPRQYAEYGNTLLGFCHGDDSKVAQYPALMANEAREAWGRTQNRAMFTGHLHHEIQRDIDGVTHYSLPSISSADRWHSRKGFCLSKRALTAYIIDKALGPVATFISPVLKDIPYGFKLPGKSYGNVA
jgi:hypothetical protein